MRIFHSQLPPRQKLVNDELLRAARNGDESEVRLLLKGDVDVHMRNKDGQTPLLLAAKEGHKEIVRLLLEENADIEASDESGTTALLWATKSGHKEVVRFLLRQGADFEATEICGQTALHLAAILGDEKIIRLLVKGGAAIEVTDDNDDTAFMLAERAGHYGLLQLLENDQGRETGEGAVKKKATLNEPAHRKETEEDGKKCEVEKIAEERKFAEFELAVSGRWRGYYYYQNGRTDGESIFNLSARRISGNGDMFTLEGSGSDSPGTFTIQGTVSNSGRILFRKSYTRHYWDYSGNFAQSRGVMEGNWGGASGTFFFSRQ